MPELLTGLFLGLWAGVEWGFDPTGSMVVGGIAALLAYMASCLIFPFRSCWWCHGDRKQGDGRGNYRLKRACWWCRDEKHNRRVGARLMGRG